MIQTVLGPVDVGDLGMTLVHEHIYISYPGDHLDPTGDWDRARCVDLAVERMQELAEHGVRTVVDPCPIDLGRDPELLAEVSQRSGINIICATGFYVEHIGIPYYWRVRTSEEITELFLDEIDNGIGATGIRPGVIKVATGDPPTELERKVIRAAGIAAAESGYSIITHCESSVGGDLQQEILSEVGVDLSRCLIGHQDQATDVEQLIALSERGSFVGIDRIGYEVLAPEERRVELITAFIQATGTQQLCLSQDHMCCLRSPRYPYAVPNGMEEAIAAVKPMIDEQLYGRHHSYLFTDFWPRLEAAGMSHSSFLSVLTDNPRVLLGGT